MQNKTATYCHTYGWIPERSRGRAFLVFSRIKHLYAIVRRIFVTTVLKIKISLCIILVVPDAFQNGLECIPKWFGMQSVSEPWFKMLYINCKPKSAVNNQPPSLNMLAKLKINHAKNASSKRYFLQYHIK